MTVLPSTKLVTYVALSGGALFCALLFGRIEFVVLAVPMVTAVALGLALTRVPRTDAVVELDAARCLEKEALHASVTLTTDTRNEADVAIELSRGLRAKHRHFSATALDPNVPRVLTVPLHAERWGLQRVGDVGVRAQGPGGLVVFDTVVRSDQPVRVYPAFERMRKEVEPPQTQVFTGNYVARASGDGIEFSNVRPFVPGDSRRRVNWRVTSRRRELHVNEFHPERNADVVLFLDTFADVGPPGRSCLDLAVRGASTLARHYLLRKDRVGIVAFGGLMGWITARSGRPHLHRVTDYVIGVEATLSYARKDIGYLPRRSLPQLALVIAFSPLMDERALKAFADLHARGFSLVVIDTLAEDWIEPVGSPEHLLALRAWKLSRAAQRFALGDLGIPVVPWSGEQSLEVIAARLPSPGRIPRRSRA